MSTENANEYFFPSHNSLNRNILWIASVALIYFVTARLSLFLVLKPEGLAAIWPAEGIYLSAILLTRRSLRPYLVGVLFITDFIAEMFSGIPLPLRPIYSFSLTVDAVLGSWLLLHFVGKQIDFRKVRDVVGFLLLSVIFSNAVGSLLIAAASGFFLRTSFWRVFQLSATSEGISNLLITPLILSWVSLARTRLRKWNPKRVLEGTALFIPLIFFNHIIFHYFSHHEQFSLLVTYSTFPYVLWASLRFGMPGASMALFLVAVNAIHAFVAGNIAGPVILFNSNIDAVIIMQMYLAILAISSLFLAAAVNAHKQAENEIIYKKEELQILNNIILNITSKADLKSRLDFIMDESLKVVDLEGGTICFLNHDDTFDLAVHRETSEETINDLSLHKIKIGECLCGNCAKECKPLVLNTREEVLGFATREVLRGEDIRFHAAFPFVIQGKCIGVLCVFTRTDKKPTSQSLRQLETIVAQTAVSIQNADLYEAVHESEGRYRAIVQSSPDAITQSDLNGRILMCNTQTALLHGYERPEDLIGKSVFDLFPPDELERAKVNLQKTFMEGIVRNAEYRFLKKDGSQFHAELSATLILDADGKPESFMAMTRDITERKRAENALRESEERFILLTQASLEGIAIHDKGRILDANQALADLFGYELSEIIGMDVLNLAAPESLELIRKNFLAGYENSYEAMGRRKDGTVFVGEIKARSMPYHGRIERVTTIRDITERQHIDEAMRKSSVEWQTTFDAVNDSVCLLDEHHKILRCNKSTLEIFGKSFDEIKGQYCWKIVYGLDKPLPEFPTIRMQKSLQRERAEIQQGEKWLEVVVDPILDENGKLKRIVHIIRDITIRKQAEEKIQRANRVYVVISQINQAIVRYRDRNVLLKEVCRIAVEYGKFGMAWVGFVDEETKLVNPAAFAGFEEGFLSKMVRISVSDIREGHGPTGTAIREGRYSACNEIANDPRMIPWREDALKYGYCSSIALPLKLYGKVIGAFTLYAPIPHFFDQEEIVLLDEVTNDISFALESIETEKKRQEAENELRTSESKFRELWGATVEGIVIHDQGKILELNDAMCRMFGIARENAIGKMVYDFTPEELQDRLRNRLVSGLDGRFEAPALRADGTNLMIEAFAKQINYNGNPVKMVAIRDVTERKQAEEALHKSEERMRAIVEGTPHLFFYTQDAEANSTYVSPTVEQITGYKIDAWLERKDWFITDAAVNQLAKEKTLAHLLGESAGEPILMEIRHSNGNLILLEAYEYPIKRNGKVIGLQGVAHDITESKRAEKDLRESEERFRSTFEQISVGMAHVASDGKWLRVNNRICDIFGYSREELLTKKFQEITHPDDIAEDIVNLHRVMMNEIQSLSREKRYIRKDGSIVWTNLTITAQRLSSVLPEYMIVVIEDISERKLAEEKVAASQKLLQEITDNSTSLIYSIDVQGRFLLINRSLETAFGVPRETLIGKTREAILPPEIAEAHRANDVIVMKEKKSLTVEEENIESGVKHLYLSVKFPLLDMQGDVYGIGGISTDITEQRNLQNQFQQVQKMQTIGTLAGGIAHDFNNILAIIMGYSSLLERRMEDKQKIIDSGAAITKAAERGAALVRQILTFARRTDVSIQPLNISEFLIDLISMLEQTFPKLIEIRKISEGNIPTVNADHTQMHQALLNLCLNARDAMPSGGTLTIKVSTISNQNVKIHFSAASAERYVCISVTDTGTGIDAKTRERIFDPFFTTKEKGKGTGLGLSVVYGVMQTHHGFVDVESEEGKGSTFYLYLPVQFDSNLDQEQIDIVSHDAPGGTETLLLVEDEEILRMLVQKVLESKGYRVFTAADGFEAVNVYSAHKNLINLVLTDVGLPKMTGFGEFTRLKEINPNVKVLLTSGFFEPDIKSEMVKAGVKGFLNKPYKPEDALRLIREVLDKE